MVTNFCKLGGSGVPRLGAGACTGGLITVAVINMTIDILINNVIVILFVLLLLSLLLVLL